MKKIFASAALAIVLSGSGALAATCNSGDTLDYSGFLTSNSGCQIGSSNNDAPHPATVNSDGMFGATASNPASLWIYSSKDDGVNGSLDENPIDFGFSVNGTKSGSWSFSSTLFKSYLEAMIVQKGGNGSDQSNYVGFLITKADGNSGSYDSVFSKANKNGVNIQDISHMSLYVRGTPSEVPLPAAAWFLLAGIGGLFGLRRLRA